MAMLCDIERLLDDLCRPRNVSYVVTEIGAYDDVSIHRDAEALLVGKERDWFLQLRSLKRKAEYCAGRVAAKSLLASPPFCLRTPSLEILRDPLGAPRISGYDGIEISIAHSGGFAVAVAAAIRLGVDLERDEARPTAFAQYFLGELEREVLARLPLNAQQNGINQLWCRKEAACKVGGWGSTLEFQNVDCSGPFTTVQGCGIQLVSDSRAGFVASLAYEVLSFEGRNRETCCLSENDGQHGRS